MSTPLAAASEKLHRTSVQEKWLLDTVAVFFSALYSIPAPSPDQGTCRDLLLLTASTRFSPEDVQMLGAPVTVEELWKSLRAANQQSAPGPSGLPYPLWELLGEGAIPRLRFLAEGMMAGFGLDVSLQTTLLHKKGDKSDLANYRPISVSDTAIRVLTRVMANRLQAASGHALPWTQGAFIAKRRTSTLVTALQGILDDVLSGQDGLPESIVVISLDQQKAYDRISREWLLQVLQAAGVPDSFLGFMRALYSDTTLQVMINGQLTQPVHMQSGLLQGDPLSCSAYNLALQPLMDLIVAADVGVEVLSCIAFADDVLILLPANTSGLAQWTQVEQAITTYESASGAKLNRAKSNFFLVSGHDQHSPGELDLCAAIQNNGFRQAEPINGELRHLGHPIRVEGPPAPCPVSFGHRMEALGKRISQLTKDGTDIALRVKLCNSLLTPMLWHHTATGPLPLTAAQEISEALKQYLFLGARSWLDPSLLHLPKHLGGLGLIDPDHMFTAQSVAIMCHHLLSDDALGRWMCRGIALALHDTFGTSPAIFLLRTSAQRRELQHRRTRSHGLWGRLIHALACTCISIDPKWVRLRTHALLELPWCDPERDDARPPSWSAEQALGCINQGWETWGDILWHTRSRGHNQTYPDAWPLGPPGPKAAKANHNPRPGRKVDAQGPKMGQAFGAYWRSIDPNIRDRLRQAQYHNYETSADGLLATPRVRDPAAKHFPWHLLLFHGRPLRKTRTRTTRAALGPVEAASTAWPDSSPATPKEWQAAWTELHAVPASSAAISDTYLWMHRSARVAKVDYVPAPCPHPSCTARESSEHSYVVCPAARQVWAAATTVAEQFGIESDLDMSPQNIALGWPDITERRPRLILWRTMVIHFIATTRNAAIRRFEGDNPSQYNYGTTHQIRSRIATLVAEGIQLAWTRLRTARKPDPEQRCRLFRQTWATNNLLLTPAPTSVDDQDLLFSALPTI